MLSALNSTAADDCGDCGIMIAGVRAVVTAAAVIFLIGERLRRKLILLDKSGLHITVLTAEIAGLLGLTQTAIKIAHFSGHTLLI